MGPWGYMRTWGTMPSPPSESEHASCYSQCGHSICLKELKSRVLSCFCASHSNPTLLLGSEKFSRGISETPQFLESFSAIFGEGNGTPLQYSCLENPMDGGAWKAAVHGVAEGRTRLSDFTFTFHFHALEKEMATHSSVLAWRIPGTEEPGGLPSMGSHRVGHH